MLVCAKAGGFSVRRGFRYMLYWECGILAGGVEVLLKQCLLEVLQMEGEVDEVGWTFGNMEFSQEVVVAVDDGQV